MADASTAIVIALILGVIIVAVVLWCAYEHAEWCCGAIATIFGGRPEREDRSSNQQYTVVSDDVLRDTTVELFLEGLANEQPIRFMAAQLVRFTRNNSVLLGRGGFGTVYQGALPNGLPVAVKVFDDRHDLRMKKQQFMAEMGTIGRTHHNNVVRLYGFCFDGATQALVYEYMEHGSLDDYLSKAARGAGGGVSMATVAKIATDVARGLMYLHQNCQPKILHLDIKPGNVLLDGSLTPKVTDFGLAHLLNGADTHVTVTHRAFTPVYAAPEVTQEAHRTDKCDVYSFGVLLLNIVCRGRNLERQQWYPRTAWSRYQAGQLKELMVPTHGEDEPRQCKELVKRMYKVAFWCVQKQPQDRRTMSEVVNMLEGKIKIDSPPNPF